MKRQGKLFKKLSKKIAAFTTAMLVLQPLLMVGVMPAKAFAASYEAPADSQGELDTTSGSFGSLKTNNDIGMHVNSGETLYVDTFDADGIDENDIQDAVLKIKYKTEEDYTGTDVVKYAIEGNELSSTEIVPTLNEEYVIQSYNLFSQGIDIKEEIETLDVAFTNNSDSGDESDEDVVIDYLWVEVETNEVPQVTFINQPDVLTNLSNAEFEWEGQDDTTDPSSLEYSYRLDGGEWSEYFSDEDNTADFVGLSGGAHTFDLRTKDEDLNLTTISYGWTIDTVLPEATVNPLVTNDTTPTITGTYSDLNGEAEAGTVGVLVVEQNDVNIVVTIDGNDYDATLSEDGTWSAEIDGEGIVEPTTVLGAVGLSEGPHPVTVHATDPAGNVFEGTFEGLIIDTIVPSSVTDLKAVVGNGKVDLSWTNPADIDGSGFAGVKIVRTGSDGSSLTSTTLMTGEAYSDTTVTNGVTYTYDVYAVDKAGNESAKASVSAIPATPVAPAISSASTSRVASAVTTETFTPPVGEVKAAEITKDDDQGQTDDKGTEVKETKKIPVWGIIFLLILAAIGGYLFYVQNPENKSKI